MNNLRPYNFIVYQNATGLVQQITNTTASNLPRIPEEKGVTAVHVNFYNGNVCDTYYEPETGKFFEDEEKTIEITDPVNYVKPIVEE